MAFRSLDELCQELLGDLGIDLEKMGQPKPARVKGQGGVKPFGGVACRFQVYEGGIALVLRRGNRLRRAEIARLGLVLVVDNTRAHDASTARTSGQMA